MVDNRTTWEKVKDGALEGASGRGGNSKMAAVMGGGLLAAIFLGPMFATGTGILGLIGGILVATFLGSALGGIGHGVVSETTKDMKKPDLSGIGKGLDFGGKGQGVGKGGGQYPAYNMEQMNKANTPAPAAPVKKTNHPSSVQGKLTNVQGGNITPSNNKTAPKAPVTVANTTTQEQPVWQAR